MSTDNNNCANCGKGEEESTSLKNCVACKLVKYCSRDCQKAHRPQHKKECRKHAAELHDEKLFKQPSPREDCPICFLRVPTLHTGNRYQTCCGKIICSGCIHAVIMTKGKNMCPFCRALAPETDEELIKRVKRRVEVGDAEGIYGLGYYHSTGMYGLQQDIDKALELWHRAGELGYAASYYNIALYYRHGEGGTIDEKKAIHYYELAAIGGYPSARHSLGCSEGRSGNIDRALKHFMIAVEGGYHDSLKQIKRMYTTGRVTRDDYSNALKAYQAYLAEIKSDDRDKAAAYREDYKYYE